MAYTAAMDEATPAGTDAANTADDQLRDLKRDIKERIQSVFVDWNADPLTAKGIRLDSLLGAIYSQDSADNWIASITPNKLSNGIMIGNGDSITAMISSRTVLLAAALANNNKLYFISDGVNAGLVIHYNSLRILVNSSGVSAI